jgi:hypothetical protein
MRPEGLSHSKIPVTPSGIEAAQRSASTNCATAYPRLWVLMMKYFHVSKDTDDAILLSLISSYL